MDAAFLRNPQEGKTNSDQLRHVVSGATWSGGTVTWEYDALSRVSAVKLGGETVTSHLYDLLGRRTDTVRGLAASHYGYDLGDQLTDLSHSWSGGSLAATYHYDAAGQLDGETMGNPAFLWQPAPTLSKTTTYDPATPINALTKVDGVAQFHDARGNRTGAAGRTWRYDSRNMLAGSNAPGMAATYGYYPEGGRAWKQVNGVTTLYLELDGVEWGTYDAAGTLKERTIRASGTGGAVVAVHSPTAGLIRLLPNRQGSVIGWLRPDGKLGGAYTYDAYGNSPQAGAGGPAFRYAGMRFDAETGLYHTPFRAYDPVDGRWMQLDPAGLVDGLNRYAYVGNSPVNGVDPTGLEAYLVARRLGFTSLARHMFVVVAPSVGAEPNARFSFGPDKTTGMLVNLTGTKLETDIDDAAAWRALTNPQAAAEIDITFSRIDASDDAVIKAGTAVGAALGTPDDPGNIPYFYAPEVSPGAANSNSAATKVAADAVQSDQAKSPKADRSPVIFPPGAPVPGAMQAYRVPSQPKVLCTGSRIERDSC